VPVLLRVVAANLAPDSRRVPLLFFAISALVRMAAVPQAAAAVGQQGGLQLLVDALNVAPAAVCQVTEGMDPGQLLLTLQRVRARKAESYSAAGRHHLACCCR
jgi:hypothetical protein